MCPFNLSEVDANYPFSMLNEFSEYFDCMSDFAYHVLKKKQCQPFHFVIPQRVNQRFAEHTIVLMEIAIFTKYEQLCVLNLLDDDCE